MADLYPLYITLLDLNDDPEPRLTKRQEKNIKKRPIQSIDDLTVGFEILWKRPYEGGPNYVFRAQVTYPLIAYRDSGKDNYYNDDIRYSGHVEGRENPHAWDCPIERGNSFCPAFSNSEIGDYYTDIVKQRAMDVAVRELNGQEKNVLEEPRLYAYTLKIEEFNHPKHMAMLIANTFNYQVGVAIVRMHGVYEERGAIKR